VTPRRIELLGVPVDCVTMAQSVDFVEKRVASGEACAAVVAVLAKERCEVHGDGCSIVMDDFAQSEFFSGGKRMRFKTSGRDKGFYQQLKQFCQSVMQPEIEPMSFDGIASVTRTCLAAVESMKDGEVKRV
jgi:hypothetical protein